MFDPPPRVPNLNLPQTVRVLDAASAEDFYRRLRQREAGLNGDLNANEVVTMELHTPAGERIYVQDVGYYRDTDTLLFQGFDSANNLCQIIAKTQGLQVMFRVITLPEDQPRKRIGFRVYEEPEPDDLDTEEASPT